MKDTFYFTHDYNTRSDPKIKKLFQKHGLQGYGIFWALIEDLYQNANVLPTDYESIAYDLRAQSALVESVINDFELFKIDNGIFYSESIQRRLEERNEKSEKARKSAEARWKNKKTSKNDSKDANALQSQSDSNAIKEKKGKERKENTLLDKPNNEEEVMKMNATENLDDNDDVPEFLKKNREEAQQLKQQLDAEEEERKSSAKKKEEEVSTFIERKTWEYKNKNPDKYDDDFYESFIAYWTAENDVGKQRWQEGYFSINRAIGNWHTNEQKFKQRDEYKRNNSSTASQAVGTSQNLPFGGKYLVADPQKVVASFRARQEAQGIK